MAPPYLKRHDTIAVSGYKMNIKHKEWIKILLFPHLITAGLLGPTIIIFWVGGFISLYSAINVFSELGRLKYYIYIGLPLIFAVLSLGLYWKNLRIGKILISSAIYLWFLLGFLCLGWQI